MERKSFQERLEELPEMLEMKWVDIARALEMPTSQLYGLRKKGNPTMSSVERIAHGFDLIPVVLYREDDGQVEDLGIEGFLYGEKVDNYVGRVIAKRRKEEGMNQSELCSRIGIKGSAGVSIYETGRSSMSVSRLEQFGEALGIVPAYLVEKLKAQPVPDYEAHFKGAITAMEEYLVAPRDSIDLRDVRKALEYADRIIKLRGALGVKVDVLNRD